MATQPGVRTEEQKVRDRIVREAFVHEPSWDDLAASGEIVGEPTTLGALISFRKTMVRLRQERERQGLSLDDVAGRAGLDRGVIGGLEDGRDTDSTLQALARYADALGWMPTWECVPYPKDEGGSPAP